MCRCSFEHLEVFRFYYESLVISAPCPFDSLYAMNVTARFESNGKLRGAERERERGQTVTPLRPVRTTGSNNSGLGQSNNNTTTERKVITVSAMLS